MIKRVSIPERHRRHDELRPMKTMKKRAVMVQPDEFIVQLIPKREQSKTVSFEMPDDGATVTIGRHEQSMIRIKRDSVSWRQAELRFCRVTGVWEIHPISMKQSTYLNDLAIKTPRVLQHDDVFRVSKRKFRFIDKSLLETSATEDVRPPDSE